MTQQELQEAIIDMLPDNEIDALEAVATLVANVVLSIGCDLEGFLGVIRKAHAMFVELESKQ